MSAIYILWLRQIKRFYRFKPRLITYLVQPFLYLLAFGFGFGPIYQKAGGGNYLQFFTPGLISVSVLTTAFAAGIEVIWDRQFGFLKQTLVAPISRLEIMIGKTLGGATVAIFEGIIILIISFFLGFKPLNIRGIFLAIIFMFLIGLLFAALGTAFASLLEDMHGFQMVMNFLIMPMYFLSGAFFPLEGLPKSFVIFAKFNPVSYGVDGLRYNLTGSSYFGLGSDFLILSSLVIILFFVGAFLFSKIQIK